jgi:hypothetical protein
MFKKATAFLTSAILGISAVALSCSVPVMAEDLSSFPAEPVKIGVEAFDTTDEQFMALQEYLDYLADRYNAHDLQVTAPRSGVAGNVGIESTIDPVYIRKPTRKVDTEAPEAKEQFDKLSIPLVTSELEKLDYVVFSLESI